MIYVTGPRDKKKDWSHCLQINVTSHSTDIGKDLSPFFLGPCPLYDGWVSKNVENGWQYAKVYSKFTTDGEPNDGYFYWASKGWNSSRADRYPMGKGAIPEYSYWNGEKLDYITARKKIYIPLYSAAARKTNAYKHLAYLRDEMDIVLWDFDGYETKNSQAQIMNDKNQNMGHAFVLKWMLEGTL